MPDKLNDTEMMRDILKENRMGMWIIELQDGKKSRMYADDVMLELLGLTRQPSPEQCYSTWWDNIEEEYYPIVTCAMEKVTADCRAEVQYPWNHPTRGKLFIRCCGMLDPSWKEGIRIRGYHQDITDAIILRQEKESLEALNREILSSVYNIFFAIYRVNAAANLIIPLRTPEDIQGVIRKAPSYSSYLTHVVEMVLHPEDQDRIKEELSREHLLAIKEEHTDRYSTEFRRLFGEEYRWTSVTVYYGDTDSEWWILAMQDIHDQKCKEEEHRIAMMNAYEAAQKANQAKNEFLSRMSHDVRTPMNAIMGMTTLAVSHMEDREQLANCLKTIRMATTHMIQLVNEVLDMSKIESGSYKLTINSFKLTSLIDNMMAMAGPLAEAKEQHLKLEVRKITHDSLIGDTTRIQQAFMNIITNANKYTPRGGHIRVRVEEIPYFGEQYGRFRFTFQDDGVGMQPDYLEHIFEPFSREEDSRTSKVNGSGLGMAITKSIIQLMDGTIQVESEPGKGSCFTVILNLRMQDRGEEEDSLAMEKGETLRMEDLHLEGSHILLAEDNDINREIEKEILGMSGACVDTAENGKEAVDLFLHSAPGHYDAIFMDIQMPLLNGNEAAALIRSSGRTDAASVPIIAMTANAFVEDVLMSEQVGMNEHVAKPIDIGQLAAVMKRWIRREEVLSR